MTYKATRGYRKTNKHVTRGKFAPKMPPTLRNLTFDWIKKSSQINFAKFGRNLKK